MVIFVCYVFQVWSYFSRTHASSMIMVKRLPSDDNASPYLNTLDAVRVESSLDCARICCTVSKCSGYRYQSASKTCHIKRRLQTSDREEYNINLRITSFQKIEEMVKCGEAEVVPGARRNTTGYFPGDVTTYTCNPDYTPCHNRTTSVCQSTGQWEHVNDLCGQFRWHKPQGYNALKKEYKHSLPCGPVDQFMVTVLGRPTENYRVNLNLCYGADILFQVDFRFFSYKKVVINSYFNGYWGVESVKNKMPLTVHRSFNISVRLHDGKYKVFVDHSMIENYSERNSGMKPAELTIGGSVSLKLVEFVP